jgi:CheY-like chemotaxis protein
MKAKKILLVADDPSDAENVRHALVSLGIPHTLHIVHNGADALATLMGSSSSHMENYTRTGKVQPDLILLDQTLPDMGCLEFLSIMRKYYSLKNIRVQILAHAPAELDAKLVSSLGIAGCIPKMDGDKRIIPAELLRRALNGEAVSAFLPFLALPDLRDVVSQVVSGFAKMKAAMPAFAGGIAVKSAAVTGTAVLLVGTASYVISPSQPNDTAPAQVSAFISTGQIITASTTESADTFDPANPAEQQAIPLVSTSQYEDDPVAYSAEKEQPADKHTVRKAAVSALRKTAPNEGDLSGKDESLQTHAARRVFVIKAVADEE